MKKSRINAVVEWLESKFVKNILIFLEFARFYRRFVREFSQIATSLIDLIKGIKKSKICIAFFMIEEVRQTFQKLKRVFINVLILQHYNFQLLIRMKIDVFKYEIEEILTQKHANEHWHFTAYFNYKFKKTEKRWNTHDKELYVIVLDFKNWRHYL